MLVMGDMLAMPAMEDMQAMLVLLLQLPLAMLLSLSVLLLLLSLVCMLGLMTPLLRTPVHIPLLSPMSMLRFLLSHMWMFRSPQSLISTLNQLLPQLCHTQLLQLLMLLLLLLPDMLDFPLLLDTLGSLLSMGMLVSLLSMLLDMLESQLDMLVSTLLMDMLRPLDMLTKALERRSNK